MALKLSAFTWGAAYANTLNIGYPVDSVVSYPQPREGSEWAQFSSGVEDAYIIGTDYYLEFTVRWIPGTTTANPTATGWDGATGWVGFLAWAREKNALRFVPDRSSMGTYFTCYLVEPLTGAPGIEDDGTRQIRLILRSSSEFTGF